MIYITHVLTHVIYITHITYITHMIYITRIVKLIFKAYKKTDKVVFQNLFSIYKNEK